MIAIQTTRKILARNHHKGQHLRLSSLNCVSSQHRLFPGEATGSASLATISTNAYSSTGKAALLKKPSSESQRATPICYTVSASVTTAQRRFFGSTNGEEDDSSPGKTSITVTGEFDDSNDDTTTPETAAIVEDADLYTVPVTISMPPMDDVGGDESHCFVETWHFKEGDRIERDTVLCDISTPDFVFGMQVDDEEVGILKEIHVAENVKVPDNTPLCTIYHKPPPGDE
mmetsp:Transcript_29583/g.43262  ORF Transcript_29583/g.43262 Transcript_29583/m.43262 type:complete len:229 (+) Transcript_29583:139-825(+)